MNFSEVREQILSTGLCKSVRIDQSKTKYCITYFLDNGYRIFTLEKDKTRSIFEEFINHYNENI